MKNTICLSLVTLHVLWKYAHPENIQYFIAFFPLFLGRVYRIILLLHFYGFPPPPPSATTEAAAVALATLQNKLVAFGPSVPNLSSAEAVCFLFLFVIRQKSGFVCRCWPSWAVLWELTELLRCSRRTSSKFKRLIHSFGFRSFHRTLGKIYACNQGPRIHQYITVQWDQCTFL